VIDGIQKGDILGTFGHFYADDVVMSENGVDERVGKAACRSYEEAFVGGVDRVLQKQVAVQSETTSSFE
jgi:hypothetical protein